MLTAAQCRGARAMLDWTRAQLAEASGVSQATLADFEAGKRTPYGRTLADIRSALERAGAVFDTTDARIGVWVDKAQP